MQIQKKKLKSDHVMTSIVRGCRVPANVKKSPTSLVQSTSEGSGDNSYLGGGNLPLMPGRKTTPVVCSCDFCCSAVTGGRQFPSAIAKSAHLARIRLERSSSIHAQQPDASGSAFVTTSARSSATSQGESDDIAAAQVFATALLDPGPDLIDQPSKLWTSRMRFQSDRGDDIPTEIPLSLILDGFGHLQEASDRVFDSEFTQIASSSTPASTIVDSTNIARAVPTSQQIRNVKLDRKSKKSLDVLRNLERRIVVALQTLASPSNETLRAVEQEIDAISLGLERVSCRKLLVVEKKQAIFAEMDRLRIRVRQLRKVILGSSDPIPFDASTYLFDFIT